MELITKLVSRAITGPWPHMLAQWPTCPLDISRSSHCQPLLTQGLMSQSLDFQVGKLGWQRVLPSRFPTPAITAGMQRSLPSLSVSQKNTRTRLLPQGRYP